MTTFELHRFEQVRDICFPAGIIKPLSDQMYDGVGAPDHAPFPMPRQSLSNQKKLYKSDYDKNSYSSFEYVTAREYDRYVS